MIIRPLDASLDDSVKQLHKGAFWPICLSEDVYSGLGKHLQAAIDGGTVIVAVNQDDSLLGFAFFHILGEYLDVGSYVGGKLWSAFPSNKRKTKRHYQKFAREIRAPVKLQYYENTFIRTHRSHYENDAYLGAVVVSPPHRQQGIARTLVAEMVTSLSQRNLTAIYVDTDQHSQMRSTYEKLGFEPIVRVGPTHYDGSWSLFMGKILQP